MAYTEQLAKFVFSDLNNAVAKIGRALDREYARTPNEDFLSPEYEDLRSLSACLVDLMDRYSHLTGE